MQEVGWMSWLPLLLNTTVEKIKSSFLEWGRPLSPNTVLVVPTYEGEERAALTPITVWAHQSVSASSVPSKLAATHFPGPLETDPVPTVIYRVTVLTEAGARDLWCRTWVPTSGRKWWSWRDCEQEDDRQCGHRPRHHRQIPRLSALHGWPWPGLVRRGDWDREDHQEAGGAGDDGDHDGGSAGGSGDRRRRFAARSPQRKCS